jgi:mannose/fructose/N-acetylgalactosamine-specific phosphotransferase system component IID
MWIVAIAWMYVAVMMAMAEATSPQGTILGAVITLVFYGLVPVSLVMYLLGASGRRKARLAREARERAQHVAALASQQADAGSLPAGDPVTPKRKEP